MNTTTPTIREMAVNESDSSQTKAVAVQQQADSGLPMPEVVFVSKTELGPDDIVEGKTRRQGGPYDQILNANWEIYESKAHEEKDDCAIEIAKVMIESGVRFFTKEVHAISGEEMYRLHRKPSFHIKKKVKRDIKTVINQHHDKLGLTREQILQRQEHFKQQRALEYKRKEQERLLALPRHRIVVPPPKRGMPKSAERTENDATRAELANPNVAGNPLERHRTSPSSIPEKPYGRKR